MIQKMIRYVEQNHMLMPGDVVAAGVSGGADSVCLLFLLTKLREKIPFRLLVVHVNHGIRKEADEDEAYVKNLCETWELPFFVVKENVAELARTQGISEEEAGRNLRYKSFYEVLKKEAPEEWELNKVKIAVAHNQNDRAETMLFNLVRGSGIKGLCSIQPTRDIIIRPLLCLSRKEIEEILKNEQLHFCIDCTNAEDTYTRNKIRNRIFPYIEKEISSAVIEKMNRTADLLSEANDFIYTETLKAANRVTLSQTEEPVKQISMDIKALLSEPGFLQGQLILWAIENIYPGRKDITAAHVRSIQSLCEAAGSKSFNLPYGIVIRKEYDCLIFGISDKTDKSNEGEDFEKDCYIEISEIPGRYAIGMYEGNLCQLEFNVIPYEKDARIPENQYTKWFDYDKIEKSLVLRNRKSGDYLTINTCLSRKSLKEYFIDEKIPKQLRDHIWVLAEEDHILWVIGHRISTKYKIDENTKRILQVQLRGGTSCQKE